MIEGFAGRPDFAHPGWVHGETSDHRLLWHDEPRRAMRFAKLTEAARFKARAMTFARLKLRKVGRRSA
jgi:hypothetical protein